MRKSKLSYTVGRKVNWSSHYAEQCGGSSKKLKINTITVGDFNTPLSSVDRSFRQKVNSKTWALNDTLDQMNFTDI